MKSDFFIVRQKRENMMIVNLDAIKCLYKEEGRYFILFGEFRNEIYKDEFDAIIECLKGE